MRADATRSSEFGKLIGAEVPDLWPPEHWEPHVFDFLEKQYAEAPRTVGWNRYIVLLGEEEVLIGNVGGFPKGEDVAEIGYSLLKPWQRQGLAAEGLRAVLEEIFRDGKWRSVIAHTFPALTASIRVMEKCGFQYDGVGDEEGTVRYRLMRP